MRYLILLISLLSINFAFAHHLIPERPILWHYNQTDKVFTGKVIKIGNAETGDFGYREHDTKIPTFKVRIVVEKSYRGDLPDTVDVGKIALAKVHFNLNDTYLIYANYSELDKILTTSSILHTQDPRMEHQYSILDKISANPNSKIQEFNTYNGKVCAEGNYKNGIPVGEWKYYSLSGELYESGEFKNGIKTGKWFEYHVTEDRLYKMFEAIKNKKLEWVDSVNYKKVDDVNSDFLYEISFFNKQRQEKVKVEYIYKKPIPTSIKYYKKNELQKEKLYSEDGKEIGYQKYENGLLNGKSEFTQSKVINGVEYKTVFKTVYKQGVVFYEAIYHYENRKLVNKEITIEKGENNEE